MEMYHRNLLTYLAYSEKDIAIATRSVRISIVALSLGCLLAIQTIIFMLIIYGDFEVADNNIISIVSFFSIFLFITGLFSLQWPSILSGEVCERARSLLDLLRRLDTTTLPIATTDKNVSPEPQPLNAPISLLLHSMRRPQRFPIILGLGFNFSATTLIVIVAIMNFPYSARRGITIDFSTMIIMMLVIIVAILALFLYYNNSFFSYQSVQLTVNQNGITWKHFSQQRFIAWSEIEGIIEFYDDLPLMTENMNATEIRRFEQTYIVIGKEESLLWTISPRSSRQEINHSSFLLNYLTMMTNKPLLNGTELISRFFLYTSSNAHVLLEHRVPINEKIGEQIKLVTALGPFPKQWQRESLFPWWLFWTILILGIFLLAMAPDITMWTLGK